MSLPQIYFSLVITLFIETGIYMILKHRDIKLLLVVSLMNVILNPIMNFVLMDIISNDTAYYIFLVIYEIFTTLVESLIIYLFMRFKYFKILIFAIIANAASFLVGLLFGPVYETQTLLKIMSLVFTLGYLAIYTTTLAFFMHTHKNDGESDSTPDEEYEADEQYYRENIEDYRNR